MRLRPGKIVEGLRGAQRRGEIQVRRHRLRLLGSELGFRAASFCFCAVFVLFPTAFVLFPIVFVLFSCCFLLFWVPTLGYVRKCFEKRLKTCFLHIMLAPLAIDF